MKPLSLSTEDWGHVENGPPMDPRQIEQIFLFGASPVVAPCPMFTCSIESLSGNMTKAPGTEFGNESRSIRTLYLSFVESVCYLTPIRSTMTTL